MEYKTISDTIHGSIRVEEWALGLLETLELQRLSSIRQLGLSYLVFPGANHSRLEHSLGAYHVALSMARVLRLPEEEVRLVACAALLHDIGHGPFSHTLEGVLAAQTGRDHMEFTKDAILGRGGPIRPEDRAAYPEVPDVPEALERAGLDPRTVADLVRGTSPVEGLGARSGPEGHRYLAEIIHSAIDCDQVDYLQRDAHYTGVAHGVIDYQRLLQTLGVHQGALAVDRKGLTAVEGILVARSLMYSSVYFHKTVRIAESMMARAVEALPGTIQGVQPMVDGELMTWLSAQGGFPGEVAGRLKYRRLYKRALQWSREDLSPEEGTALLALAKDPRRRRAMEAALCHRVGAPEGSVLLDVPMPELLVSEPRFHRVDMVILDGGKAVSFRRASAFAGGLRTRDVVDWVAMVAADPGYRDAVAKVAAKVIFS